MSPDHASPLADRLAAAAPWWIALGIAGVTLSVLGAPVPLLACLTLVGLGADADLARRFRQAVAADGGAYGLASIGGLLRGLHAFLYAALVLLAWATLLDLRGGLSSGVSAPRLWLAADVVACVVLAIGYFRLTRRAA